MTISDRASAGTYGDRGGPEIERVVREVLDTGTNFFSRLIPDDEETIVETLIELADREECELILTTGGTGPGWRDVTPEATRRVIDRELPGLGEVMRAVSFASVPTAILSRALAGTRGRALLINLPGNPRAIAECLPPLVPAIRECLNHLKE